MVHPRPIQVIDPEKDRGAPLTTQRRRQRKRKDIPQMQKTTGRRRYTSLFEIFQSIAFLYAGPPVPRCLGRPSGFQQPQVILLDQGRMLWRQRKADLQVSMFALQHKRPPQSIVGMHGSDRNDLSGPCV